jgi:Nuclease-related domain
MEVFAGAASIFNRRDVEPGSRRGSPGRTPKGAAMGSLRLRWWEGTFLAVAAAPVLLFLLAGEIAAGLVLLALTVVFVAWRAQIPERNVAGGYARMRALLLLAQWAALLTIYGICLWLAWDMYRHHWTRDHHGRVAFWLLVGFGFFLVRETLRTGERSGDWWQGSQMERDVARRLDILRDDGWLVIHDVRRDTGGNLDHYVAGPTGAFAIETKLGRNRAAARNQAISNAAWAKSKFGVRWVSAILCVATDPPPKPIQQGHAWVVGPEQLLDFVQQPHR